MKYIIALMAIAVGVLMVIKTESIIQSIGTSDWAESKFGTAGGTRMMYKLIGILIIFIALAGMTGQLGPFLMGTIGKLFAPR